MVDIDRLHKTLMDNRHLYQKPRQSGKTTATIYELIGAIQTTELENIVCFVKCLKQLDHLFYNLIGEMSLNGITVVHGTSKQDLLVIYEQQTIKVKFINTANESDYYRHLRGMHDYISINFIDY